ncbi:MAG: DNA recombination protein RmuC [Deltaproteobacteria bacterium]|nr:MAG: DNA recombination protein RmuC [Deltaproteobacteria bacterium]TMA83365.1 MAG: DNA recombination protein RmuC [Deltaproteobacteria bacterium]
MVMAIWGAAAVALVVGVVLAVLWRPRRPVDEGATPASLLLVQQQLDALRAQLGQALSQQGQAVVQQLATLTAQMNERMRESGDLAQRSQTALGTRLDHATQVVGEVQRGLGELREATARVYEVGRDVASLQDILRAPKLRGGLGELWLADLLSQVLPVEHYTLQHTFRSGERVDAVVRLGQGLVPVDAKFPLEDFRRLLQATDDEERQRSRRAFIARVKKHVDDIAAKYIVPDEGTYDFALMYIPAENVYYETIVRDEELGGERSLSSHALERKVIPVSPSCFYAYLQAIVLGLRGLRIEDHARDVLAQLARIGGELGRFRDEFRILGKHLTNAAQTHATADRRLDRLTVRVAAIAGGDEPERPVELPLLRATGAAER